MCSKPQEELSFSFLTFTAIGNLSFVSLLNFLSLRVLWFPFALSFYFPRPFVMALELFYGRTLLHYDIHITPISTH